MSSYRTAFVASTLPARFLFDNWSRLKIHRLICASEALRSSYLFLSELSGSVQIVNLPIERRPRKQFLRAELNTAGGGIIIFHECCWMDLDIAILENQPKVFYFPCVTLDGWRKMSTEELGILKLLKRFLKERTKISLSLLVQAIKHKNHFDFYEVTRDGGSDDRGYVTAIKEKSITHLTKSYECFTSRKQNNDEIESTPDSDCSSQVILVVASDVVKDIYQIKIFTEVAQLCEKCGFTVLVKDHPNPAGRLNLKGIGHTLSPCTPFEVLDVLHIFKIGLFSTALGFQPRKSISIAGLFHPQPAGFVARKRHLLAIPGGRHIRFVSSFDVLKRLLSSTGLIQLSN